MCSVSVCIKVVVLILDYCIGDIYAFHFVNIINIFIYINMIHCSVSKIIYSVFKIIIMGFVLFSFVNFISFICIYKIKEKVLNIVVGSK